MQLIDGIKTRRSVRKFEDKKVPHEVLEQIVEAAAFAPSWKNSQTVRYIAVEDAALKERIATEATMNFTHNKDIISACPVLIVVVTKTGICGYEKDGSYTTSKKDKWEMFDAGIASQTFMLAAHEYGVGTVTLGILTRRFLEKSWSFRRAIMFPPFCSRLSESAPRSTEEKERGRASFPGADRFTFKAVCVILSFSKWPRKGGRRENKWIRKNGKRFKKISIITLLAQIVVIAVMIGGTLMGWLKIWAFQLIACLYLVGYWAATDILEPKLTKLLEGVTEDQKKAYKKYAAMDFAGYMGILVFVIFAGRGGASNVGMIGLVVYAYTLSAKKKFRLEFQHPEKIHKKQAPVQKKEVSIREKAAMVKPVDDEEDEQ